MTLGQQQSGAWVFVSHSHHDLEKVREIRNALEKRGHKPLLFFLKCLENDDARLPELIRDEIRAREWFVLCDSTNAQKSRWVQQEVELIKGMEGKVFETIDLSEDLDVALAKIIRLSKRATVYVSYASADRQAAKFIGDALMAHEFSVTRPEFFSPGQSIVNLLREAIDEAVERGFVLVLLSPSALASPWVKYETEYALQRAAQSQHSNIVPVIIAPFPPGFMPLQLASILWFDLTTGPFEERVEELVRSLKTREME